MASLPLSTVPAPRWRQPLAIAVLAALAAGGLILWLIGDPSVAAGAMAVGILIAGAIGAFARLATSTPVVEPVIDWTVARRLAAASGDPLAVTDKAGRLVCANDAYETHFGAFPTPPNLPVGEAGAASLGAAGRNAWRDGRAEATGLTAGDAVLDAVVERAGEDMLVWRFAARSGGSRRGAIAAALSGPTGDRLAASGIMAVLIGADGRVVAANRVLRVRAMGHEEAAIEGRDFARFLTTDGAGLVRFEREGSDATPLRLVEVPLIEGDGAPILIAILDEEGAVAPSVPMGGSAVQQIHALVSLLPFGLALVGRDGRLMHMNDAFVTAAGVNAAAPPLYPGDLVVREDKAPLADAIRRFGAGAAHGTDMTVRLADRPDEPVAFALTGARGLGDAAVLIGLRDSGEEGKLKRQVAQATKMQAVGQLAGGVAHDFNNILTAIIGHCDLMLMRHTPGDSDYDDIQQVRINSNRAASLTRQLLAFSRQQTLRPQVLQLPDVISEVSNLLKRLLGETVALEVRHGRNLGSVRADPGQLEQVVVNLAVNARDAMLAANPSGGGRLTIETLAVGAAQVRAMDDDVLPVGDYVALRVSDTGTGIPDDILPNIWEPFFTTKEVGKGTGLGLSTVYGIIKQSGGYIFAESPPGKGAVFTIYLPVHAAAQPVRAPGPKAVRAETWGSGKILLVEDEDMVRAVAERALTRQGYSVVTAEHGEAALDLIAGGVKPDLVISDVVMPTMDGPTMVRQVRTRYPDMPILFMSGYAEEQLRRSIDLDHVAFLPKPFSVQELAEAARDVLEAK